jgi:hypothetical protein
VTRRTYADWFRAILDTINDNNKRTMWIRAKFRKSKKQRLQINYYLRLQQFLWMIAKWERQDKAPLRMEIYD